ncbi:MAG: hypothetical protein M1818_005955 [Claussenomyces sp. TS43310]|nr:MAG: hypothetical protein M1818_005955 [Claussenomyces sp. TS43310]
MSSSTPSFIVRPATFRDTSSMASMAFKSYDELALDRFLSPHRNLYPEDYLASCQRKMITSVANPRNISLVACPAESPDTPIGSVQFIRLGDDAGAKAQIKSGSSVTLSVWGWYYWAKFKVVTYLWPNRAADPDAIRKFGKIAEVYKAANWSNDDVQNRWHTQSLVVLREWRGKGVGRNLMTEGLRKAESDGVPMGLEASPLGELLYQRMGFELLGRFSGEIDGVTDRGGMMIWRPGNKESKISK